MRPVALVLMVAMLGTVMAVPAAVGADSQVAVTVTKAPVAPDGTTAGAIPDFVLSFADLDPSESGIGIKTDGEIEIVLPDSFVNTGAGPNVAIVLQGWQASPPAPPPFIWTTSVSGNTITIEMNADYPSINSANPGPKQVHLILNGFTNPGAGRYQVGMTITPDPAFPSDTTSGTGTLKIIPRARPSVNIVNVLSGNPGPPPFKNVQYQTVTQGVDPDKVGLYLWDKDSAPFIGVDLVMSNPNHYRFVLNKKTVGHVWIDAPDGASGYSLSTDGESDGPIRAFATMIPTAFLITQFSPDPLTTGDYVITFKLNNGNEQQQFVEVVSP